MLLCPTEIFRLPLSAHAVPHSREKSEMGSQSPTCLFHGALWNVLGWNGFNLGDGRSEQLGHVSVFSAANAGNGAGPLRLFREFPQKSTVLRGEMSFWNDWRGTWSKEIPLQSMLKYNSIQIYMLLCHLGWTSFPQSPWPLEGLQQEWEFRYQHELRGAILLHSQQIENTHRTDWFCQKGKVQATGGASRFQHTGTKRIFEKKKQSSVCCIKENSFGWIMIYSSLMFCCFIINLLLVRISSQMKTRNNTQHNHNTSG